MKRIAGRAALATLASGLAVGLASLALWTAGAGGNGAQAQGSTTIGIDANPSQSPANQPTALGSIEGCISADVDDEFDVDAFVKDVDDLRSFEFWVTYDPAVLNVIGWNVVDQFLKYRTPTGSIFDTSEQVMPDADGIYVAAGFDDQGQDDGEGVLVRLTMKVVGEGAEGFSPISISEVDLNSDTIPDYGPTLYDNLGQPIGDDGDADNYFDGPIQNASVIVGEAADSDEDTIVDPCDNCPDDQNPLQEDDDGDLVGNACDDCPGTAPGSAVDANGCAQSQVDQDLDGACDPGASSPLWCTGSDNCPSDPNPGQEDADADDTGDACDLCPNTTPADPVDSNGCSDAQVDADGDGICDPDAPSNGPSACTGSDICPLDYDPGQEDFDGDNLGNACDCDSDNGGTPDGQEARDGTNPLNPADDQTRDTNDTDGDGGLNWEEDWGGTDPFDACGDDCNTTRTDDAWAYDISIDCWVNSTDILAFPANVAMPAQLGVEPTYQCRFDLNGDEWINSTDILMFPSRIAMPAQCTPP